MAFKEDQLEVSTTTKCTGTGTENGIIYKLQEEDAPDSSDISPIEPPWGEYSDGVEDDESWNGKRGSNKNHTTGVRGTQSGTVEK